MNQFLHYLLQSSVCVAVLYMVYWLFLRKETFFTINRLYLVSVALLSLLIPLIKFNTYDFGLTRSLVIYLDPVIITPEKIDRVALTHGCWLQTLGVIYLTGVAVFLARLVFQLVQLGFLARNRKVIRKDDVTIILIEKAYAPFSFFNYLFVNSGIDQDPEASTIINHELVHARQWHSVDLIILELLTILQWFNPFVWFAGKSIKANHEFLADEGVLKRGFNRIDYQELLVSSTTGIQVNNLTNNFNVSLLKTRIIMMTKTRSTIWAKSKIILAIPAFLVAILFFSTGSFERMLAQSVPSNPNKGTIKASLKSGEVTSNNQQPTEKEKKAVKQQQILYVAPVANKQTSENAEPVYNRVDQQPSYTGGQEQLVKFLVDNIKYPKEAIDKNVVGTVYVTFVVLADGTVKHVKILRGIGSGCDEEAARVVRLMPKWTPGMIKEKPVATQFNLPIQFKLDADKDKKKME